MLKGLIGKKIGMTQIFDEKGVAYPVTLVEAGPCYVTQVREPQKEGYSAVQLGFGEVNPKRLTGGQFGHLKANELPPPALAPAKRPTGFLKTRIRSLPQILSTWWSRMAEFLSESSACTARTPPAPRCAQWGR